MRISKNFKLGIIILILSILGVMAVVSADKIYVTATNKEYAAIDQRTEFVARSFSNAFSYNLGLIQLFGDDYKNTDIVNERNTIQLEMKKFTEKTSLSLCIVNENGEGYDSNNNHVYINNGYFINQQSGIFHADMNFDREGEHIYFYSQITCNNQLYYIIGGFSNINLYELYHIDIFDGWNYFYIIDSDGHIILSPDKSQSWDNLFSYVNENNKIKDSFCAEQSKHDIFLCGNQENVISMDRLHINNWYAVSIVPQQYITKNANSVIYNVVILCICFFICILIIIQGFIQQIKNNISLKITNEANESKNRFWSHISHEIRTPMNAIVGMAEIAKISLDNREKLEECMSNIENTSEYMLSLINDILDMSKIESNKMELNIIPFKISEIIDTVIAISSTSINTKKINMSIIRSGDLDELILGDSNRLKQILVNLISNACKFTGQNGKIKFCIKSERISEFKIKYLFEITDSGVGIKKENLEKIFNPFEQGESYVSSTYGGSGLGLAICKGYLKLMNGNISVDSQYGKGTSFFVDIEFAIANQEEIQQYELKLLKEMQVQKLNSERKHIGVSKEIPMKDQKINKQTLNILLADDNIMNLEVTTTMLEYYGYHVVVAHNGQEVVDIFDASDIQYFDVILMDIQMPIKDGYEAAVEIRSLNRCDAVTVNIIALTANAFKEDTIRIQEAGMDFHITKPIKMKDLKDKLDELSN